MKLTHEQVASLLDGALWWEITKEDALLPHRFTKEQAAWYMQDPDLGYKNLATAGVRLDFTTDADAFGFTYIASLASSRRFCYVDVAVDGTLVAHEGEKQVRHLTKRVDIGLPKGTHRVTVFLPGLFVAALAEVTLTDGATFAPVPKKRLLLALGDSITQGYDAVYPSLAYPTQLALALDASLVNQGIGAEVFRPGIPGALPKEPDIVTVAYGTNDFFLREPDEAEADAAAFFRRVRGLFPCARIFALTPVWRADADTCRSRFASFEAARDMVRRAANVPNCVVIEGDGLLPHLPDMCSDGFLHPNDLGFCAYATALLAAMRPFLP